MCVEDVQCWLLAHPYLPSLGSFLRKSSDVPFFGIIAKLEFEWVWTSMMLTFRLSQPRNRDDTAPISNHLIDPIHTVSHHYCIESMEMATSLPRITTINLLEHHQPKLRA
jgi:hypothetical protein